MPRERQANGRALASFGLLFSGAQQSIAVDGHCLEHRRAATRHCAAEPFLAGFGLPRFSITHRQRQRVPPASRAACTAAQRRKDQGVDCLALR